MAPRKLAPPLHSLPPILHILTLDPVQSYSKGAQGLSVLPRVPGIFTESAISLSPWLRQWGNRYAIRAGRNLPDKEFRYLRTVIVTAAVYRGFGSQSPVFLINSRYPRFTATRFGSIRRDFTEMGTPSSEVTVSICRVP